MHQSSFIEAFSLSTNSSVSVVGSGGKSTLIRKLAKDAGEYSYPVVITTTTHIELPFLSENENLMLATSGEIDMSLVTQKAKNQPLILIHKKLSNHKARGFDPKVLCSVAGRQLLLIEADGSRRKPFKIPASWEPVICDETSHAIIVCGLNALNRPFNDRWVHRSHLDAKHLNHITPYDVARIISTPSHYLDKFPKNCLAFVYLSGCTSASRYTVAKEIAKHISMQTASFTTFTGNIGKSSWIEKL